MSKTGTRGTTIDITNLKFRFVCKRHNLPLTHGQDDTPGVYENFEDSEQPLSTMHIDSNDPHHLEFDLSYWYCRENKVDEWYVGDIGSITDSEDKWDCAGDYAVVTYDYHISA